MKKLIITMMAIAFSLSAYSQMRIVEESGGITVWCINEDIFMANSAGGLIQIFYKESRPMTCEMYTRR